MNTKMYLGMFEIKQHSFVLAHFHSTYRPTRNNFPYGNGAELPRKTQYFNKYSTHSIPKVNKHQVDSG